VTPTNSTVVSCAECGTKNRVPWTARGVPHCGKCKSSVPWVAEAGDETFAEVVEASAIPVLVDVWAPWCGPCRMVSPVLQRLAEQLAGKIKLVKVNADDAPRISARFEVRAIPTLLVMRKGEVLSRRSGAAPEPELHRWLDGVLATAPSSRD
jgi:thioredoxin 2